MSSEIIDHIVPALKNRIRLQDYAKDIFVQVPSKAGIKKAMKQGRLSVNGKVAKDGIWIMGGETISLTLVTKTPTRTLRLDLEILYEDDYLAVINKPAGILVSGNKFVTVANGLKQNLKPSKAKNACDPWPVHRLDYGTTGALLVAKSASALRELSIQFQEKTIEKMYLAIAIGRFEQKSGIIENDIDDKPSLSHYQVLETVQSDRFEELNLIKLHPKTGRRHQLRIHLASIGQPILGDHDYGLEGKILKGKGIYLHSHSLRFVHPSSKELMTITCPIPKKFIKIFPNSSDVSQ